jgi:hypothetical protein
MRITHEDNRVIVDCLDGCGPKIYKTRIDALIGHVKYKLGIRWTNAVIEGVGIHATSISKVRNNVFDIPLDWFIRIHDFSGLSIEELRAVYGTQPSVAKYVGVQND